MEKLNKENHNISKELEEKLKEIGFEITSGEIKNTRSIRNILLKLSAKIIYFFFVYFPRFFSFYYFNQKEYQTNQIVNSAIIAISFATILGIISIDDLDMPLFLSLCFCALTIPIMTISFFILHLSHTFSEKPFIPYFINFIPLVGTFTSIISIFLLFLHVSIIQALLFISASTIAFIAFMLFIMQFLVYNEEQLNNYLEVKKKELSGEEYSKLEKRMREMIMFVKGLEILHKYLRSKSNL